MRRKFAGFVVVGAPAGQLEGQSSSRSPRKMYCCEYSGIVSPDYSRKLISVEFALPLLQEVIKYDIIKATP
jgi:hypothetical protein